MKGSVVRSRSISQRRVAGRRRCRLLPFLYSGHERKADAFRKGEEEEEEAHG